MATNDAHLKPGSSKVSLPPGPIKQHHRLAAGEKVDGTSNPYGTAKAPAAKTIANARKTY